MTSSNLPSLFRVEVLALMSLALSAASCADGRYDPNEFRDGGPRDARVMDVGDARVQDARRADSGPVLCGGVRCMMWQFCDATNVCRDYPACTAGSTCPAAGTFCREGRCVPGDVDIDGDGVTAATDCNEMNAMVYPGAAEQCNNADDNCNMRIDDGDPAAMCTMSAAGGTCTAGVCGCPAGTFDIDRMMPGCECAAIPAVTQGVDCLTAINVGNVSDTGQMMMVTGNAMPMDRAVWYRFQGVDAPDSTCDNLHVRVQFRTNPGDQFEFTVFRGECNMAGCADSGFTDYSWATDFTAVTGGMQGGQCPCTASTALAENVSVCTDDSAPYFVRVRRKAPAMASCAPYAIEISNGVYNTP